MRKDYKTDVIDGVLVMVFTDGKFGLLHWDNKNSVMTTIEFESKEAITNYIKNEGVFI